MPHWNVDSGDNTAEQEEGQKPPEEEGQKPPEEPVSEII